MGVCTTAYSISPKMMRKIRTNPDNLGHLFGIFDEPSNEWQVEDYCFDKGWEETIKILKAGGFEKTAKKLSNENCLDYEGYEVWTVAPSAIKAIIKDLEPATFEELKATGLAKEVTDYYGKTIPEYLYQYYVGDVEGMKKFFHKAAEQGNYLLFATA